MKRYHLPAILKIQTLLIVTFISLGLAKNGFSQNPVQLEACNKLPSSDLWPLSREATEFVFKNEVCDLSYDSISGKVLVGLITKERAAKIDPWWKRYEQLPNPEEYKRWFPEPWMKMYPDYLSCIDPVTQKETWMLETEKVKNMSKLIKEDDFIYVNQGKLFIKNTIIDIKTGDTELRIKNEPIFGLFPEMDMVLSVGSKNTVFCRNLSNGSIRWSFSLEFADKGWNDLVKINDSTLVLSASGLYFLNITKGRIAYFPASTNDDVSKVIGPFGDKYGPDQLYSYRYTFNNGLFSSNRIWGLASNVIYDDQFVYSAGHSDVTCFDHKGKKIWNAVTDSMASGRLMFSDSLLVYINKGYGILPVYDFWIKGTMNYKKYLDYLGFKTLYSVPCIKIFNRFTGMEILSQNLSGRKDAIIDIKNIAGNDTIQMLTRNKIIITDISSGRNMAVKENCEMGTGDMCYLAPRQIWFMNSESIFYPAGTSLSDPAIVMNPGRIWQHDKFLNNVNITYRDNIWYFKGNTSKIIVIANNKSIVLLNNSGHELKRIPSTGPLCLAGPRLFMANGNKIQVIDLQSLSL